MFLDLCPTLFDSLEHGVAVCGLEHPFHIFYLNPAGQAMLGMREGCIAMQQTPPFADFERQLQERGSAAVHPLTVPLSSGKPLHLQVFANRVEADGQSYTVIYLCNHAACKSDEALQLVCDNSQDLIYVNSLEDYSLLFVNRALCQELGKTREDLLGQPCYKVLQEGYDEPCPFCPIARIPHHEGEARSEIYSWEFVNTRNQEPYWLKDNIVKWVDGSYVHMETATSITRQRAKEDQLRYYASMDVLTGAFNRNWSVRLLEEKLDDPAQKCLCFLDLDDFKLVNDSYGHKVGDRYLIEAAKIFRDILGENDLVCRWGGDEFLLCIHGSEERARELLARIQQSMQRINEGRQNEYLLGFSFGLVSFCRSEQEGVAQDLDHFVGMADKLMYENKSARKGYRRRRTD